MIILKSAITCPKCSFKKEEVMPQTACQVNYRCQQCHENITPKPGDCCVYCSYGSVHCPPKQQDLDRS